MTSLTPSPSPSAPTALLDAVRAERQILTGLADVLREQRRAVAANDMNALDETVDAAEALLGWLKSVDTEREALSQQIAGAPGATLTDLATALGAALTPELRDALEGLRDVAQTYQHELATNKELLRGASQSVDDAVHAVYGAPRPAAVPEPGTPAPTRAAAHAYGGGVPARGPSGALMDRSC